LKSLIVDDFQPISLLTGQLNNPHQRKEVKKSTAGIKITSSPFNKEEENQ
jgi:ribosomal protein L29